MRLLAGLGNPGPVYKVTRHNAGFMVVDYLAAAHRIDLKESRYGAQWGEGVIAGERVCLAKPRSYMNLSGQPLGRLITALEIAAGDLLVFCDDFNLPLGALRLRGSGSDGGHNGLKSIIKSLQTREFARLRLGIGPPPPRVDVADFVLEPFKRGEWPAVEEMVEDAAGAAEMFLREGIGAAMNKFNQRR